MDQDWKDGHAILVNNKTTSIVIVDLIPHTSYQIQVKAKNGIGNSTPSSPSSIFITKPEGELVRIWANRATYHNQ